MKNIHIEKPNNNPHFLILEKAFTFEELKSNSRNVIDIATYFSRSHRYGSFRKPLKYDGVKYYHGHAMRGSRILELGLDTEYDHIESKIYYIYDERRKYSKFVPVYLKDWTATEIEIYKKFHSRII